MNNSFEFAKIPDKFNSVLNKIKKLPGKGSFEIVSMW
jgi:hypothetical protein